MVALAFCVLDLRGFLCTVTVILSCGMWKVIVYPNLDIMNFVDYDKPWYSEFLLFANTFFCGHGKKSVLQIHSLYTLHFNPNNCVHSSSEDVYCYLILYYKGLLECFDFYESCCEVPGNWCNRKVRFTRHLPTSTKFVLFKYGYFYYKHQILRTTNKIEEPKNFIVSRWYSVMKLGIDF